MADFIEVGAGMTQTQDISREGHSWKKKTADELAAESMADDMAKWLTYSPVMHGPLEEWLKNCAPSQVAKQDGIGWIYISNPNDRNSPDSDVIGLQQSWDELKSSGRPINFQTITELAKMHQVTSGKWLMHVSTGLKIDTIWAKVAMGVWEGILPSSAKVSPYDHSESDYRHVISIFNSDYTNQEEVYALENAIRTLGIKGKLAYKPDVYTYIGVYRNNQWGLRPTIYESMFDLIKGCSVIIPLDSCLQ